MIPNFLPKLNLLARTLTWDCGFISKGNDLKMLRHGGMIMRFEILAGDWLEVAYNACDFGEMAKWKVGDLITNEEMFNAVKEAAVPASVA